MIGALRVNIILDFTITEEADDSNDPDAPYDPEKEAENTTPKQGGL